MHEPQPGLDDGGDDLTEGPLPFQRTASRERVVDVAAAEVVAVRPNARPVSFRDGPDAACASRSSYSRTYFSDAASHARLLARVTKSMT